MTTGNVSSAAFIINNMQTGNISSRKTDTGSQFKGDTFLLVCLIFLLLLAN